MPKRNDYVDFLRGIAILLVVLGHTMQDGIGNEERTFLYEVLWSLQMPLFFLISGYVTRYSRSHPSTLRELAVFVGRKTYAYLLPFAVWTFLVHGVLFDVSYMRDIPYLAYAMDMGYWFLFSLWTITLFFGIATYLAHRLSGDHAIRRVVLTGVFFTVGAVALCALGLVCGLSFLGIKLTLYYMPIYLLGYLFGQTQDSLLAAPFAKKGIPILTTVCVMVWVFLLLHYNLYAVPDNAAGIALRYTGSLAGCIALCGLTAAVFPSLRRGKRLVIFAGVHSLEIYLVHALCLAPIRTDYAFASLQGILVVLLDYVITLSICYVVIRLLHGNPFARRFFFAKK